MNGVSRHRETDESTRPCFEVSRDPGQTRRTRFDMASKTIHASLVITGYFFSALISHEIMYLENNQNVGNLLLFIVSHVRVKMAESFAANTESHFRSPKTGEEESLKVSAREYS